MAGMEARLRIQGAAGRDDGRSDALTPQDRSAVVRKPAFTAPPLPACPGPGETGPALEA